MSFLNSREQIHQFLSITRSYCRDQFINRFTRYEKDGAKCGQCTIVLKRRVLNYSILVDSGSNYLDPSCGRRVVYCATRVNFVMCRLPSRLLDIGCKGGLPPRLLYFNTSAFRIDSVSG